VQITGGHAPQRAGLPVHVELKLVLELPLHALGDGGSNEHSLKRSDALVSAFMTGGERVEESVLLIKATLEKSVGLIEDKMLDTGEGESALANMQHDSAGSANNDVIAGRRELLTLLAWADAAHGA